MIAVFEWIGDLGIFFGRLVRAAFVPPHEGRELLRQIEAVGPKSFLLVALAGAATGAVLSLQTRDSLTRLGAASLLPSVIVFSLIKETGPIITGLIVSGRVGAGIGAELGSMKVTEQIEALETMALNPVRYLVVPRFLALLIMLPCLTIFADILGIFGGFLVGVFNLGLNPYRYITFSFKFMLFKDFWTGIVKSACFGIIIAMIGCYMGLRTKGGAEGVGKSTTSSVVTSFILIILFDVILTGIFYFANK